MKTGSIAWNCLVALAASNDGLSNADLASLPALGCPEAKNVAVATGTLAKKGMIIRTARVDGRGSVNTITTAGRAEIDGGGAARPAKTSKRPAKTGKKRAHKAAGKKAPKRAAAAKSAVSKTTGRFAFFSDGGLGIYTSECAGELVPGEAAALAAFVFQHYQDEDAA